MRDKEIVGLWEAYLQVHQPKEEVEQLDESGLSQDTIRSAVKKRQERVDADYREDTPEGDERGDKGMEKLARSKRQLNINKRREVRMRANEEVEQLDEFAPRLQKPVNNILKGGQEKLKQFGFKVNENPRPTINQQKQYQNINNKPVKEEVENWVNSLIEEGYDLSEYTWDDMYEIYMTEGRNTSLSALSAESEKRKADKKRGRPETESEVHGRLALGDFRPGASQEERARGGRQRLKDRGKVPQKGGKDMFEHVLEYLVAEGYADTNESALVIMANMSEEWRESIVEAYQEPRFGKKDYIRKLSKRGGMGMGTPDDPHGYRDPRMAKVGAEFSKRKTAAAKARKTGEPDKYRAEKESQSKMR